MTAVTAILSRRVCTIPYRLYYPTTGRNTHVTGEGTERPTRGKPRERAILSAVIELLGELGYEAMTMDAVAARAHASKTTIYRRWPGKPELVRAAVDAYIAGRMLTAADTGSLRGDLMAVMRAIRGHLTAEFLAMMSGLVHAMRQDQALRDVLWSHLMNDAPAARVIIERAVARGELPVGQEARMAGLTHELIEAQLFRQIATGAPADDTFAAHVVDDLVLPVLTHHLPEGR
jgi:AcrR family transcriptional regulator